MTLLVLTALALVAPFVPPTTLWVAQLPALALPLLGWAVALAAVLHVVARRWGWAGAHLALLIVVLLGALPTPMEVVEASTAEGRALTLVTFNAGGFEHGDAEDVADLARRLHAETPDLVGWQETPLLVRADGSGTAEVRGPLPSLVRDVGHELVLPSVEAPLVQVGQPVTTSLEVVEQTVFALAPGGNPSGAAGQRVGGGTRTVVRFGEREVAVYNVHLRSYSSRPRPASRRAWMQPATWADLLRALREGFRAQAAEAVALRTLLAAEPRPYLVCGDFNSVPGSWVWARLAEGHHDLGAFARWGRRATFPAPRPFLRIDFVFASPEWRGIEAKSLPVRISDHRPLVVRAVLSE